MKRRPTHMLIVTVAAGFAVGFSKLSDIYGRKNMLAIAWLLFTLGSVWCGIARRMGELYALGFLRHYCTHFGPLTEDTTASLAAQFREWGVQGFTAWPRCVFSSRGPVDLKWWGVSLGLPSRSPSSWGLFSVAPFRNGTGAASFGSSWCLGPPNKSNPDNSTAFHSVS
jgi:MFS family permease